MANHLEDLEARARAIVNEDLTGPKERRPTR
jgi:hypothetical protein